MAIEAWIDEVARIWGTIKTAEKGNVKSYLQKDFPEAISEFPAAITFVTNVRLSGGSDSGPHLLYWTGQTEFYIAAGTGKQNAPKVSLYFDRILRAAMGKRTLGGKVIEFSFVKDGQGEAIIGPAKLNYGGEQYHLGLVVNWRVKEELTAVVVGN